MTALSGAKAAEQVREAKRLNMLEGLNQSTRARAEKRANGWRGVKASPPLYHIDIS